MKNRVIHILFDEKRGPIIYLAALKKGAIRHAHPYYAIYRKLPHPHPCEPNIINLSQTVWELWPAQDFCFRGDNYITKKVRVVLYARDKPTGPLPITYQTFYLKQCGCYGLHQISASGEITT